MATKLIRVADIKATPTFGKIPEGKNLRNLVVSLTFGEKQSLFSVTGERSTFSANMTIPEDFWEKHDKDADETVKAFRKELEKALADGSFALFGHTFSVSELTDGEHSSVYNTTTKHTIEVFSQALETDDADEARKFVRRALTRQVENKKFLWSAPTD